MKIGIVSDTHDDLETLDHALHILNIEEIDVLLHCGDLCGPAVIEALSDFEAWIARGNMDRHPELVSTAWETIGDGRFGDRHRLGLAGRSVALLHGHRPEELSRLVSGGGYAYVIHGHTHRRRNDRVGRTRVVNPGALGGSRWQRRSFCILDLKTDRVEFVRV